MDPTLNSTQVLRRRVAVLSERGAVSDQRLRKYACSFQCSLCVVQREYTRTDALQWRIAGSTWRTCLKYLLTPWSRVLFEQIIGFQIIQKFPAFYGTRRFVTAFTRVRHLSLCWASSIQSIPLHPTSWKSILILSFHLCLGLPVGLFPSGVPTQALYEHLLSPIHATRPAHLILDFMTRIILARSTDH